MACACGCPDSGSVSCPLRGSPTATSSTRGPSKWFWLERNRWRTVLSVYPAPLLAMLAPALLAAELGLLAVAARQGWLGAKLRAQAAVITGLPRTLERRRAVQRSRRIGAREFASHLTSSLDSPYLAAARSPWLSLPQALYWRLVRRVLVPARELMRVGLDLLYLIPGETGGREIYARELVPALLERSPELELVAFVNRDAGAQLAAELGEGMRAVVVPVSARSRGQWALGELALVSAGGAPRACGATALDGELRAGLGAFRRVVTIHDLHYLAVPELLSWPMRTGTSALVSLGARGADRIIAVSAAGREEIVAGLEIRARADRRGPQRGAPAAGRPIDSRRARAPPAWAAADRARGGDQSPPQEPARADRRARADRARSSVRCW